MKMGREHERAAAHPEGVTRRDCPLCGRVAGTTNEVGPLRLAITVLLVVLGGAWFTILIAAIAFLWLSLLQHALNLGEWGILCLYLLLAIFFTPALGSMAWFFITVGVDRMRTWIRRLPYEQAR